MKKLLLLILVCLTLSAISQSKMEFGITTEGSWFLPSKTYEYSMKNKMGLGAGIGAYASKTIYRRLSANIGLLYRYKQMQQHYSYSLNTGGGYGEYEQINDNGYMVHLITGWKKYPLHNIVIPVHLQLLLSRYFFIRGGVEESYLLNFDKGNNKPNYSWTAGFGSQKHKLKWSLNYIRGFKDEGFYNGVYVWQDAQNNAYKSITSFRNTIVQLSFSYPILHLK